MQLVNLDYLIDREGGLDTVNQWQDVLSGGEKQRIVMARLLYHEPSYAILDDCTSAVSGEIETNLYMLLKEKRITLFTVTHKNNLFQFHDYILRLGCEGDWSFEEIVH